MDNSQRLNELFSKARNQAPKTSFLETKANFNNSLKGANESSFTYKTLLKVKSFKTLLIMMLSIATLSIGLIYLVNPSNEKESNLIVEDKQNSTIKEATTIEKVQPKIPKFEAQKIIKKQLIDLRKKGIIIDPINTKNNSQHPIEVKHQTTVNNIETYIFPNLTKQQVDETFKQKRKMLKELSKFDKKKYAFIPSATKTIRGEQLSIQAFYIQTTEVSVLEYRTFLFDLLIQDRKDEFLMAKPDQTQWLKYGEALRPMVDNYFSHEAYNDYPINNISKEGIELYCRWLNQELTKQNGKVINDVRLPSAEEWMYAAKGENEKSPYPWGGPYLRNSKGCFLANFKPGAIKPGSCGDTWNKLKNVTDKDSLSNYIQTSDDVILPKETKDIYSADGGYYTVKVSSYNPNDFGLYCMSGNVAEMVLNENRIVAAKGGGWNSIGQQLQIEADNDFENAGEPNPEIGFRVVISYIDNSKQSFSPFGTKKVSQNLFMDETEISNFSWKEYLKWIENKFGKESETYKKALPDTVVWSSYLKHQAPYDEHYFNHPAYNDYPVVGITYEQAISYCNWRTDRVKEYYVKNPDKNFPNNFQYRLPTKKEWENVASVGYDEKTLKKMKNMAHINVAISLNDTIKKHDFTSADVTAPIKSYWSNTLGIYNMVGNVAEMVQEKGVAKGGSWIHSKEESDIDKDIIYKKQECWLGFRCVFEELK